MTTATTRSLLLVLTRPCRIESYATEVAQCAGTADPAKLCSFATVQGTLSQHSFCANANMHNYGSIVLTSENCRNNFNIHLSHLRPFHVLSRTLCPKNNAWKDANKYAYDITVRHRKIHYGMTG